MTSGDSDSDVIVRVTRTAICGSDLHEYRDGPFLIPARPHPLTGQEGGPLILGHEFSAEVVAVGEEVTTVQPGDRVALVGRNGSGKSTLLNLIGCLDTPTGGELKVAGLDITRIGRKKAAGFRGENIGFIFQDFNLIINLTALENVMIPMYLAGKTGPEVENKARELLGRVGLLKRLDHFPDTLSGGQQQRVAIARAIVMNPKYLFCDEPNSGLDPRTAILIDNLIQEITREYNITTVINTHDMNSVMEIGEKIVFLRHGVKEWEGSHQDIFRTDNQAVSNFVYSSELFKKVRQMYLEERD